MNYGQEAIKAAIWATIFLIMMVFAISAGSGLIMDDAQDLVRNRIEKVCHNDDTCKENMRKAFFAKFGL